MDLVARHRRGERGVAGRKAFGDLAGRWVSRGRKSLVLVMAREQDSGQSVSATIALCGPVSGTCSTKRQPVAGSQSRTSATL
jgi:hypothetical protein